MQDSYEKEKDNERYCTECGHLKTPGAKDKGGCDHDHDRFASVGKNFCPHCGKKIR